MWLNHDHARTQATRDARHGANSKCADHPNMVGHKGGEHRDGWQPNSLVAEQVHPQHGSGAIVRESPEHGSGARLRTTAVTEPKHARAPLTEDWIENITFFIASKNTRVPEFWVVGSTDMHEEKNIDTIIRSIYRLR